MFILDNSYATPRMSRESAIWFKSPHVLTISKVVIHTKKVGYSVFLPQLLTLI